MATFLGYSNFNGKNGSKFSADLLYDIIERNEGGNYTVVRLYGYIRSWGYAGSGSYANFVINGANAGGFNRITANQYKEVARRDIRINHNAEGKANLDWSFVVDTTWSLGDARANGSIALPDIPRKSNVTCTDGSIGSSVSINIQRASNNFTHTLKYSFGSLSGTIATGVGSSYGWTLPDSFYSQIPNDKSGTGTITCETYSGGTHIGTTSTTFRAYAVEGNCNPQVVSVIKDINPVSIALTGDSNKLIKGISNANIKITASARKSAKITRTGVSCSDGKSGTGSDVTLNGVEGRFFTFFATDSRGYTTPNQYEKAMVDYIPLTCNINIYRPQPTTGEVKLEVNGNYFNGSFGKTNNTLTLKYRFKKSGENFGNYVTIDPTISGNKYSYSASLGTGFDYKNAYDFEIVATDKIKSLTIPYHVSEGVPMLGLFKDHLEAFGTNFINNIGGSVLLNNDLIMDIITNGNGTAIKFNNGLMLQWGYKKIEWDASGSPYKGWYYSDGHVIEFPVPFKDDKYSVSTNREGADHPGAGFVYGIEARPNSFTINLASSYTTVLQFSYYNYIAIGTWK